MESQILDQNLSDQIAAEDLVLASKGKRFANLIIDNIIRFIIALVLTYVMASVGFYLIIENVFLDILFTLVIILAYYSLMEAFLNGKSLGKFVTQTRAVQKDGSELDFRTALIRSLCRIVPFEPFSFLGDSNSGWHDNWSNTIVIDETKSGQTELNDPE